MLWRKLMRDVLENKAAYLACLVVISIGLMVYTSLNLTADNLWQAKENFYREYGFPDGFATVQGISDAEIRRLTALPGVARMEGRIVQDVRVIFPGREESAFLRLVTVGLGQETQISKVKHLAGLPLDPHRPGVWVDPQFLAANELEIGGEIPVIIGGRKVFLEIRGQAQSPEYVYPMRTAQDLFPDPRSFGIAYLPLTVMRSLAGESVQFNQLIFQLEPAFSYQDVESLLEPRLERFGLVALYPAKDQVSNFILNQELSSTEATANVMPLLFLAVGAVILYILLKRIIEQQRGQIGTLRSFGYGSREIQAHYLSYPLIIGLAGGLLGSLSGLWLSFPMTAMYQAFFHLPELRGRVTFDYVLFALLLSVGFALLAGYFGSRQAMRLSPAEAMRPPAPLSGRHIQLERWNWFWHSLTVQGKMATRNLFRHRQRSLFTFVGIMFCFSMIAVTGYFNNIISVMIFEQMTKVQTHDIKINFAAPLAAESARRELLNLPGIKRVEVMLEAPATLKHGWRERDTVIIGLGRDAELFNLFDQDGRRVLPPEGGLILSSQLAEALEAKEGTIITLESALLRGDTVSLPVHSIIPQYMGINAYMDKDALNRVLRQGELATSALLVAEEEALPLITEKYREASQVATLENRQQLLDNFNEMMATYGFTVWILAVFAFITGFAVIYSFSIVALAERKRELASLRVLGMTTGEVSQILTFEQWLLALAAILAGIPFTMYLIGLMAQAMGSDLFTLPLIFEPNSFIIAFVGTVCFILLAQWTLLRQIRRFSLVEALKERD
ncbi:MAG: FtsX-like permease family protein [Clostridium sp.]|nr:FtsX-like permease family protein [Clostridium sp.]